MLLTEIGDAGHDWIQEFTIGPSMDGTVRVRKRKRPGNEDATADMVGTMLAELNPLFNNPLTSDQIKWIMDGIRFTAPEFDVKLGTMVQPRLQQALATGTSHPVSVAIAFADLADPGKNPLSFLRGGDELLLEEQLEIAEAIRTAKARAEISTNDQARFLKQLQKWDGSQAGFALGRRTAFEHEISFLSTNAQTLLRQRFNRFEESTELATRKAARRACFDFWRYVEDVGFPDIPLN
ncbi:hypothetical protein HY213_02520 [Candidatus Peregrinibacteria bacterium]|nr:hypothetical protein [Candidatus Peregrinibacteria bacterium]